MSAPTDANKPVTPVTTAPGPESPTTARPLEMDDDDFQEPGVLETSGAGAASTTAAARAGEDAPPPKPPRPTTEQQKNQMMLKEAFPTLDEAVIKAVLTASGGRIDPAFNALLEMTDPDAANREVEDESPPAPPPRPAAVPGATPQSQLEADELYARQLAQHYENVGAYEERTSSRAPRQQTGLDPNRLFGGGGGGGTRGRGQHQQEPERSFVDDDLPIIKENLRKGFEETQKTVNTWFQTMKKRFDEEFADDQPQHQQGRPGQQRGGPSRGGRVGGDAGRRSGDYERYDADPQVLSDDFAGMKFHNDGTPVSTRNSPNPNIFRPPPPSKSPRPGEDRKVSFRDEADEIGDVYNVSPNPTGTAGGGGAAAPGGGAAKSSKWQPLSTVDPNPIAENDPFSLGDSDDEKDAAAAAAKPAAPPDEIKMEDAERLRKAAAEAMNESLVDDKKAGADGTKKT